MARIKSPEVRILTSAEALAKARAEGEAYALRDPPPAVSLRGLGRSKLNYHDIQDFARAGEPLVQQLREIAGASGAPAAAACVCLMRLGHRDAAARLSELLASETSPAIGEFLNWVGLNDDIVGVLPDLEALRRRAEQIAQTPDHPDRLPALRAAFAIGTTLATTAVVETLVRAAEAKRLELWTHDALRQIVRGGGDAGLAAARALLQPPFIDWARNARESGRLRDRRLVPDIERVLSSGPKKAVQGALLEALADIQGAEVVPRLLDALDDQELSYSAATALGRVAEGTGDEALVTALVMSAAGQGPGQHAKAVAQIGGPLALRSLAGLFKRVPVFDAMYCLWRVKGITTSSALRRFVEAEVIPAMPAGAEIGAVTETGWAAHDDVRGFWHVLRSSGRLVDTVGEDGGATEAARHPILIERFAAATGGKLPIEHASQVDGPKDARDDREVDIQFVCGDRVYQATVKVFSRNFDFVVVRTLLNEALRDRGQPERFTRVQQQDCETLIFGPQAAVEVACDELCLPYGTEHAEFLSWQDRQQARLLNMAGETGEIMAHDAADIAFHIFRPTRAGAFPHDAVNDAVGPALGSAAAVAVRAGTGWTEVMVRITRDQFTTAGADAIESLFVSVCDTAEAHFGRTLSGSDWARITEGELAGAIDAIDWLQYFGPRFGTWLRGRSPLLSARQSPRGAQVVKLDIDPIAPLWQPRQQAAKRISLRLRPFPPSAQEELDPEARLKRVSPPEPAVWKPEERDAMFRARAGTLSEIERGMANGRLFDRFRRRYLSEELESPRLDRIATWLPHYGAAPAAAAFRAVARLHDMHPAAAPMDDIALEGCVKLVAWGGEDRPLLERELLMEHVVDPRDPGVAIMARSFPDWEAVAGMVKMTAMQVASCDCERCTEVRKMLAKGAQGRAN